jgi:hypothetical protein
MIYKMKQKHTNHITISTAINKRNQKNTKECGKRKTHTSSKFHVTYTYLLIMLDAL